MIENQFLTGIIKGGSQNLSIEFSVLLCMIDEGKWQLVIRKFMFPVNHAPSYSYLLDIL